MNRKGFSLIELLIVVAIILIIAAIAIPNLLRSRIAANESSAAAAVRSISTAEVSYAAAYPTVGFAADLSNLGGTAGSCTPSSTTACLIDSTLTAGVKSGYSFAAVGGTPSPSGDNTTYAAGAAPLTYNQTGVRLFCAVQDGVLRADPNTGSSTTPPNASNCPSMGPLQ